jgi:hypothetical protein
MRKMTTGRCSRRVVQAVVAAGVVAGAAGVFFASQAGASQFVAEKDVMVYTPENVHCFKLDYTNGYNLLRTQRWVGEDGDDRILGGVESKKPGAGWTDTGIGVPTSGSPVSYITYNVECKVAQKLSGAALQRHVVASGLWPNKANGLAHVWIDTTHVHKGTHKV